VSANGAACPDAAAVADPVAAAADGDSLGTAALDVVVGPAGEGTASGVAVDAPPQAAINRPAIIVPARLLMLLDRAASTSRRS
jgi:hypothetical protein